MIIPYAENAVVDMRKLREYCLSPEHDEGKHKALLFSVVLGITAEDADELRKILLRVVSTNDAKPGRLDAYGQRYAIDFRLGWRGREAWVRSGWILEHGSENPKLTTCYLL